MNTQKNTEKLTDKAFSRLFITSILGIVICLVCLCSTTWAWFSKDVSSSQNVIQSGEGKLTVAVTKAIVTKETTTNDQVEIITDIEQVKMRDAGTYTVTMTLPQGSASGYCVICVGDDAYRSPYILRSQETDQTVTFYIKLEAKTELSIESRWGIYSDGEPDVLKDGTLTLPKTQTNTQE